MADRKIAKRTDWKTSPMPAQRTALRMNLHLTAAETEHLVAGHIPYDMDDKWFIYLDDSELFFHRSWTGICVYRANLERHDDGSAAITSAFVNRDPSEYKAQTTNTIGCCLCYLIERLLAGRDVPFPIPASNVAPPGVFQHHTAGSGNREVIVPTRPHKS